MNKPLANRSFEQHTCAMYCLPLLIGVLVALQVFLRTSNSITLTYDSWVYWESGLALASGHGYVTLTGDPVVAWPPLFPALLAIWHFLFTLDFSGVRSLLVTLSFFAGFVWSFAWQKHAEGLNVVALVLGQLLVIIYIPVWYDGLLSESLWIPLLGILFLLFSTHDHRTPSLVTISIVFVLCLLCRNQSIVLAPAFFVYAMTRWGLRASLSYVVPLVAAVIAWLGIRGLLGQLGSHAVSTITRPVGQEVLDLVALTGDLFAVSSARISEITLVLVAVITLLLLFRRLTGWHTSKKDHNGIAWLFFAVVFWVSTGAISILTGMPIDQPRFYLFSVFAVILALILIAAVDMGRLIWVLASIILLVTISSSGYRAYFFAQHRSHLEKTYEESFLPSSRWIEGVVGNVDEALQNGEKITTATGQFGISPNTYRRWKGVALLPERALEE